MFFEGPYDEATDEWFVFIRWPGLFSFEWWLPSLFFFNFKFVVTLFYTSFYCFWASSSFLADGGSGTFAIFLLLPVELTTIPAAPIFFYSVAKATFWEDMFAYDFVVLCPLKFLLLSSFFFSFSIESVKLISSISSSKSSTYPYLWNFLATSFVCFILTIYYFWTILESVGAILCYFYFLSTRLAWGI